MPEPHYTIEDIGDLLHDASMRSLTFNAKDGRVSAEFECLRTDPNTREQIRTPVEIALTDVTSITATAEPWPLRTKPSEMRIEKCNAENLREWLIGEDNLAEVAVSVSEPPASPLSAPWQQPLKTPFDPSSRSMRISTGRRTLMICFADLEVSCHGQPLSLQTWADQYSTWWIEWKRHWRSPRRSLPMFATRIWRRLTMMLRDSGPSKPDRPACLLEDGSAPSELLSALRDYFEGIERRDEAQYRRAVLAGGDAPWEDSNSTLYADEVTGWWIEDRHAFVTITGSQYDPADPPDPAWLTDATFEFALFRSQSGWRVRSEASR
jgi:hypothetical protein